METEADRLVAKMHDHIIAILGCLHELPRAHGYESYNESFKEKLRRLHADLVLNRADQIK